MSSSQVTNPSDFSVESHSLSDGLDCVVVQGEVDLGTGPALKTFLYDLIEASSHDMVLDFDQVRYLDSSGMGVLVGAARRIRERNRHLFLICNNPRLTRLFAITGLARIFDIFESEESLRRKLRDRT